MHGSARTSVAVAIVGLLVLIVGGAMLISLYLASERERDLLQWESRLGLVADGKADAIARLLQTERRDLEELAGNASLQLYLWQFLQARAAGGDSAPQGYLRNLLLATAERGGYLPPAAAAIPANVPRPAGGGLALFDADLRPVAFTPGLADAATLYRDFLASMLHRPGTAAVELLPDGQERPVLAIAVPVGPPPGTLLPGGAPVQGILLAVRSAEQELLPLLIRGPTFLERSESLLLARRNDSVLYLSPTRDGTGALRRSLPLERHRLAEAAAVLTPGRFVQLDNYLGQPVLQVSRQIRSQNWVLAQQVDADQALAAGNERRGLLLGVLSLLLLFIAASVIAAWRHGSSVRARQQASELAAKAEKLERKTELLHAISDSIDVLTLLTTREHTLLFTNQATAQTVQIRRADLVGRSLEGIFPAAAARLLQQHCERAGAQAATVHELLTLTLEEGARDYQASFIPVERMGQLTELMLIVLADVTELREMELRHTALLRNLVTTLAHVVDQRDPYSAEHTARMQQVTDAVARELKLDEHERESLDLAATLANIGKIMIPTELLTKAGALTPVEQELLRKHVEFTLELLKGIEFDGPVLEIIAQKQERLDGSGYPRGLTATQMSLAGRILAVANAFVALVSARAWREGIPVQAALDELLAGADTRYDRRVIAALFHVAENRLDWSQWPKPGSPESSG